jgi:myosin heavy subunit
MSGLKILLTVALISEHMHKQVTQFFTAALGVAGNVRRIAAVFIAHKGRNVAMAAVGTLSAQDPRSVLTSAEIAHDKAVTEQKQAVENARNEERRIVDAANERLSSVKDEYADAKEEYKRVLEEQKRRVEMAREKRDEVKIRYKQEKIRRKQEIAAAKARTKGVTEEHKSRVAQSKAEIARLKSESPKR